MLLLPKCPDLALTFSKPHTLYIITQAFLKPFFTKNLFETFVCLSQSRYFCTPIVKNGLGLCHNESESNYSLTITTW